MKPFNILQLMGAFAVRFMTGTHVKMSIVIDDNFGRASVWLNFKFGKNFLSLNEMDKEYPDIVKVFFSLTQTGIANPLYEAYQSKFCISGDRLWDYARTSARRLIREVEEYIETASELGIEVEDKIWVGNEKLSTSQFRYEFANSHYGKAFIDKAEDDKLIRDAEKAIRRVDYIFSKIASSTTKFYSDKVCQMCDGTLPSKKMTKDLAELKQDITKLMRYSETLADFADKFLIVGKRITEDITPKMHDMGYAVFHQTECRINQIY